MGIAMELFWMILLLVLIVAELATVGLLTIWFAAGALAAEISVWLHAPIWLQVAIFIVVSVVMLAFTRPFAMKYINNKDREKTNVDSMIGRQAIVTKDIDNIKGEGQVVVQGMEWTARSENDDQKIFTDEVVEIRAVSGVKLIVTPVK